MATAAVSLSPGGGDVGLAPGRASAGASDAQKSARDDATDHARATADDAPELPRAEEPDRSDDDAAAIPPDYTDLLQEFSEAEEGLDDDEARDVETGVHVDEGPGDDEDEEGAALDLGDLLDPAEVEAGAAPGRRDPADKKAGDDAGDETGPTGDPAGLILGEELDPGADGGEGDDGEGAIEPLAELVNEELPGLDDADDGGAPAADAFIPGGGAGWLSAEDDDLPRPSELPWTALPARKGDPQRDVARLGGRVLSAGPRLVRHDDDDKTTVLVDALPGSIEGLVSEPDGKTLLATTANGVLLRLRAGGPPEPVTTWREALPGEPARARLHLGGPTPSARPALLLLLAGAGVLLESTDQGTTFRQVDLGGRVLCVSRGAPPLCVVETPRGVRLMRSESSGGFRVVAEPCPVDSESAEGAQLATDGEVVALLGGREGEGIHVSADGGATFRRAMSTRSATAVTAGRLGGRPCAFAALYAPASGRATLCWIDATTGESLAIGHLDGDADEDGDPVRVTSLAWDPATETLWAGTPSGLRRFRRPASA